MDNSTNVLLAIIAKELTTIRKLLVNQEVEKRNSFPSLIRSIFEPAIEETKENLKKLTDEPTKVPIEEE